LEEKSKEPMGYVPSLDHAEKLISSFEAKKKKLSNFLATRLTRTLKMIVI